MTEKKEKQEFKYWSVICPFVLCTLLWVILAKGFEFYYDLNDDVLIKDILSGIYTGTCEPHNMQMMYPISLAFALLYRLLPAYSWMGFIEILCMWMSAVIIAGRIHILIEKHAKKRHRLYLTVLLYIGMATFVAGCLLWEAIMLQYTVVCGVLTAAAAIYVITDEEDEFRIGDNIVPIILCILAFNIRSEMFMLLCPFLAVAGLIRWMREGFSRYNVKNYLGFIAIAAAGILLTLGVNKIGYGSIEWQEFCEFFDARTRVYDFTGIPGYEDNKEFYASIGLEERDVDKLEEYNFVFSKVTTTALNSIADYVESNEAHTTKQPKSLSAAVKEYVKSVFRIQTPSKLKELSDTTVVFEDNRIWSPLNIIVLVLYMAAIVAAITQKDKNIYIWTALLMIMRSVSWLYVILKDRVNARIAHPMYLIEICILLGMIMSTKKNLSKTIALLAIIAISVIYIPGAISTVQNKQTLREAEKEKINKIYEYTSENPREYYYLDVYDMVADSDKVFVQNDYGKGNAQLAGGWMALSPLDEYKSGYYEGQNKWFISTREIEEYRFSVHDKVTDEDENVLFYVYDVYK